jgi:hypothetical protein
VSSYWTKRTCQSVTWSQKKAHKKVQKFKSLKYVIERRGTSRGVNWSKPY